MVTLQSPRLLLISIRSSDGGDFLEEELPSQPSSDPAPSLGSTHKEVPAEPPAVGVTALAVPQIDCDNFHHSVCVSQSVTVLCPT